MADFWTTAAIKATRKTHRCEWCRTPIEQGRPAIRSTGVFDGEFQSRIAHVECEEAVIEYHSISGADPYDGLADLSDIIGERENWTWLLEEYSEVAARIGLETLIAEHSADNTRRTER